MDWFKIEKGVHQGCILSPCLFNLHVEYIRRYAGLDAAQAGIKIAGRNIINLRYEDDTTIMAESEEELKSLLMKAQEESEKVGLKLNIQKSRIMASSPIILWQIDLETMEVVRDLFLAGFRITADGDCSHEIKRRLLLGRKIMSNLDSILKNRDITLPTKVCLVKAMFFPMSQLFAWGGQSTGVSALASVLPMNTQDRSPLGWTGWISLQSKGLWRAFSNTTVQ